MKKLIKTDISTFEDLINNNCLYVDKTEFVWKLVRQGKGTYFLSRPRRFGKSLLLTTFDAYFSGKKELFKGLKIEKLAHEKWDVYPIIRLQMDKTSNCKTTEELSKALKDIIKDNAKDYNIILEDNSPSFMFANLINELYEKTGKSVVVLVDEYDKPILDNIFNKNINDILDEIKAFYQILKTQNGKEQFVFITGVTKFAHTSMFLGMNNPTDLTMNFDFATMLGYTEEELLLNFKDFLPDAAKYNKISKAELMQKLKKKYDGFRFAIKAESVFNPVSVGKFFYTNEFDNYWSDTGTPWFLYKAAKNQLLDIEDKRGKFVNKFAFDKYEIDKIDPFVFAVQCGYLTIKDFCIDDDDNILYKFDYPNKEVKDTFSEFLFKSYTDYSNPVEFKQTIRQALYDGDTEFFKEFFNAAIANISYENIGKNSNNIIFYEGFFRNLLSVILTMINVKNIPERQTINGKIDLVSVIKEKLFIFEIKAGEEKERELLINKAMTQIVDKKKYHTGYMAAYEKIYAVALVFDKNIKLLIGIKILQLK